MGDISSIIIKKWSKIIYKDVRKINMLIFHLPFSFFISILSLDGGFQDIPIDATSVVTESMPYFSGLSKGMQLNPYFSLYRSQASLRKSPVPPMKIMTSSDTIVLSAVPVKPYSL